MPRKVGVATEGPASKAVIEVLLERSGHVPKVRIAEGKGKLFQIFDKLLKELDLRYRPACFLVVPDLQPEEDCRADVAEWKREIRVRFPRARLCTAIWETEAWLLADASAVERVSGMPIAVSEPDRVGGDKPSEILERHFRQARGYGRGPAFDKRTDGAAIAQRMDLGAASTRSPSFGRFMRKAATDH